MNTTHHEHATATPRASAMSRPVKIGLLMVAVIAGFFLAREHWDHLAGSWVFLLLLACPLMHLFHGHGGHGQHGKPLDKPDSGKE
jgi:hypothetical protein